MGKKKGGGIFGDMFTIKDSSPKKEMAKYRRKGRSGYKASLQGKKAAHIILAAPRNEKERAAKIRGIKKTNRKILRAVKRRLFW
jgi:hypothetical protein